ncbi:hypothetical protein GOV13_01920 [Candidatus Pacearchaeota archaeon]|nr:hypothetical protein [Candidatus Pacearchaeota archaeon]
MKRGLLLFSIMFVFVLFLTSFTIAANETNDTGDIVLDDEDESKTQVEKAYDCLQDKVDECSTSLEDNIFTLLAIKKCKSEVLDEMSNDECWPKGGCKVKETAQAILALDKAGTNTNEAEEWLISRNQTPSNLVWLLQIDSSQATTCTIKYRSESHQISIDKDKKINSGAGACLSLEKNWWLRISSNCFGEEFEIQCHDSSFTSSLLFKKSTSPTYYVSSDPHEASAEGTTTEKVFSVCFGEGGTCSYEGSLWATLVLNYLGYDSSAYIPYLVTMADENQKFLPESFLYSLTGLTPFRVDLLQRQESNQFWEADTHKFYDTALALYPFQDDAPQEKSNSMDWLLEVQGSDGCWGTIKETAFLLHSIWPGESRGASQASVTDDDCEEEGYYCMSQFSCEGEILSGYSCAGVQKCCDIPSGDSCEEQGGEICGIGDECSISTSEAGDTSECCLGYCREIVDQSDCAAYGGICRNSCFDEESESSDECTSLSDVCCIEQTTPEPSYWWVWLLLILIILLILGIIFRDRLRPYWLRLKSMFGKPKPGEKGRPGQRPPMPSSRIPMRRPVPRRVIPPSQGHVPRKPSPPKKEAGEIDDVLKKLKDMGK